MTSKKLETRLAQVAVVLTLAGAAIRVLHLFDNNSLGRFLLVAGLLLLTVAMSLRARHQKQLEERNHELEEKVRQLHRK